MSCVFQAMRTLSWKPHLGSVTLDVELQDRTLTYLTVSPIHAAIILHFQEKSTFTCWSWFFLKAKSENTSCLGVHL